jgi:sugar-specific transcriptional regulator TrmB
MFSCTKDTELAKLANELAELKQSVSTLKTSLKDANENKDVQIDALHTAIKTTAEVCTASSERYALALNGFKNDLRFLSDALSETIVRNATLEKNVKTLQEDMTDLRVKYNCALSRILFLEKRTDFTDLFDVVQGDITTALKPLLLVAKDTTVTITEETPENMTFFNTTPNPVEIRVNDSSSESLSLQSLRGVVMHLDLYHETKCLLEDAVTYFGVPVSPCKGCE